MLQVLLGVTGGIAAFKASSIIRLLAEAGHDVKVIPTQNALRFIGAATLEALSHNSVDPDLYADIDSVKHIKLGQEADLIIVAPATAAFIARFAAGIADDLLLNTLLATKAPIVIAPAMHTEMWLNPATKRNIETLKDRGVIVIEPAEGRLTGPDSGVGRLPEPEQIVELALRQTRKQDLLNKFVTVTAGGTREPIDPVRFIGNNSSGRQGVAIAEEALARGANVHLVLANVELAIAEHQKLKISRVTSAAELSTAVSLDLPNADVLVMAAAVSDFRVESPSLEKIKRGETGGSLELKLIANDDILASSTREIKSQALHCLTVGFAAETASSIDRLTKLAESKLVAKGCDLIVANDVSAGAVFGEDKNDVLILTKQGRATQRKGTKSAVANAILDVVADMID